MNRVRLLYWLAAFAALGGILGALLITFGQVLTCAEFTGCHEDNVGARIAVALAGFTVSGILLTVASARRDRWRRGAQSWRRTDSPQSN
jgi:hypothetical protein